VGRSFSLLFLKVFQKLREFRLISLQKNFGSETVGETCLQIWFVESLGAEFECRVRMPLLTRRPSWENLDLVITSDTAMAASGGRAGNAGLGRAFAFCPIGGWLLGPGRIAPWYPKFKTLFARKTSR